jgi:NADH:ubiquinone oxidoreductase subunit 5 (subunit L)/multisubunit Na+/H+ antiporter MnhA subunit
LIAYSTLAQIGYLFLMFPLAFSTASARLESGDALAGGLLQTISHASAKAAMFLSAGLIYAALGHDRIAGLAGIGRALPVSVIAFALAGVALIGVPPSGAYLAKELLLQAASGTGQWWWAVAVQAGGILTSSYVVLVLVHALAPADQPVTPRVRIARMSEAAALALALCSLLLGLVPWQAHLPVPSGSVPAPPLLQALLSVLWPLLAGGALAILLGRWDDRFARIFLGKAVTARVSAARCATLGFSNRIERIDGVLRQWPAAGLCMLVLAIAFAAAMLAAR